MPTPLDCPHPSCPASVPEPPGTRPGTTPFSSPATSRNPGPLHRSGYTRQSSSSSLKVPGVLGSSRLRPAPDVPRVGGWGGRGSTRPRPAPEILSCPRPALVLPPTPPSSPSRNCRTGPPLCLNLPLPGPAPEFRYWPHQTRPRPKAPPL